MIKVLNRSCTPPQHASWILLRVRSLLRTVAGNFLSLLSIYSTFITRTVGHNTNTTVQWWWYIWYCINQQPERWNCTLVETPQSKDNSSAGGGLQASCRRRLPASSQPHPAARQLFPLVFCVLVGEKVSARSTISLLTWHFIWRAGVHLAGFQSIRIPALMPYVAWWTVHPQNEQ
jgi:hypothetical protein